MDLSRWLSRHPHVAQSARAAAAATVAWLLVQPMGGLTDEYPYYAPLAAALMVTSTVTGSVRGAFQGVGAIVIGAGITLVAGFFPLPGAAVLALVVALGTLVGGWRALGPMASWVPLAALFVLVIGRPDPVDFALVYVGLTTLGATVGVGINLVVPPLPLAPAEATLARLRDALAEQLDTLADGLRHEDAPTEDAWRERRRPLSPLTAEMRDGVTQALEARRGNWRARRWSESGLRQHDAGWALERLAFIVEDVTELVTERERADRSELALGPRLRPQAAVTFEAMAEALRSVGGSRADPDRWAAAAAEVTGLAAEVRMLRDHTGRDLFEASTLVMACQRALTAIETPEPVSARDAARV